MSRYSLAPIRGSTQIVGWKVWDNKTNQYANTTLHTDLGVAEESLAFYNRIDKEEQQENESNS